MVSESNPQSQTIAPDVPESPSRDDGPIPLSFPAILRNPGVSHRFAHLHAEQLVTHIPAVQVKKNLKRDDNEGKRWIRRKENAHFVGNPHIVHATRGDYALQLPQMKSTFPEPLPAYLPRTAKLPDTARPALEPNSANAGRFSLSLKGMRRDLRKAGFRAQVLVQDIEREITAWLQGGAFAAPDVIESSLLDFPGTSIGRMQAIYEVSRTPLQMVWSVHDDAFARYVVHCCARYYEVVSFSKEVNGRRLTYLLRPNVTRPDSFATIGLDTPPITDLDSSSHFETDPETDALSDILAEAVDSDAEKAPNTRYLPAISEADASRPLTPDNVQESGWSIVGESDIEGDESGHEADLTASIQSLTLQPASEPRRPLALETPLRSRQWSYRQDRSASSPSRSPARRIARRRAKRRLCPPRQSPRASFFDYLFA